MDKAPKLDPIEAYDRIAPEFARISKLCRDYFDRIERLIISQIPPTSRWLLDIGVGDGTRALCIATAAGINDTTPLEPGENIRRYWRIGSRRKWF